MTPAPWLVVTGDFTPLGGMDRANHALAMYLAGRERAEVHLVTHRAWHDLQSQSSVQIHHALRPRGSHLLGIPFLSFTGRRWARRLSKRGGHVVVNGGNCHWGDVNWVHYVHASWTSQASGPSSLFRRVKGQLHRVHALKSERDALRRARLVVTNSERTRIDVIERLGVAPERVHTIYYGSDPDTFGVITPHERQQAKAKFGWLDDRPVVAFVGALGDHRKGFDTLFSAWKQLAADPTWRARLVVAGAGGSLSHWQAQAAAEKLDHSMEFLGFRDDIPTLLAASDVLVSPTRYEAYGLNVQEALCRGLPAIVSATAGVAERYPSTLQSLLLPDPENASDLADRLRNWQATRNTIHNDVCCLSELLRLRSWDQCASEIVNLIEGTSRPLAPMV